MHKKHILLFSLLLSFIVAINVIPTNAHATSPTSGSFSRNLTWHIENSTLTISGEGPMSDFLRPEHVPWNDYRDHITAVVIENGVNYIGKYAFKNCTSLTTVSLPDTLIQIADEAFYQCRKLTSLTLPDSVTHIGRYAFFDCASISSIDFSNSLISIGDHAFYWCHALTTIDLPRSLTTIGEGVFLNCNGLVSVSIPNSVTTIGTDAFSTCSSLISVVIPSSVTRINATAFAYCINLSTVIFQGDAPTQIATNAFCESRPTIYYPIYRNWPHSVINQFSNLRWIAYDRNNTPTPPTAKPVLPTIAEEWTTDLTFSAAELGVYASDSVIRATLAFKDNGSVTVKWEAIDLTALRIYFRDMFVNAYYALAYGMGITDINEIEAYCLTSTGMSVSQYMNTIVTEEAIRVAFTPANSQGSYRYNNTLNAIYTNLPLMGIPSNSDIPNTFSIENGQMFLNAASWGKPDYTFVCTAK